jgi:hypothetical protein
VRFKRLLHVATKTMMPNFHMPHIVHIQVPVKAHIMQLLRFRVRL